MIDVIMHIHIENKTVIVKEDLAAKIKLISENIERHSTKDLRGLEVIHSFKTSFS